jgi:RNA polymerase sporulation-specific sigma factor
LYNKEETENLITLAQKGDLQATERLISINTPLVKSIVRRFRGRGVEYDDLFQLGSVGLLKAIRNFSIDFDVCFSTYAVPMIMGEIKRYLRDDGYIKISRTTKTLSYKINMFSEQYKLKHQKSPTIEEIAKEFSIEPQEAVFVMDSTLYPISIYEKTDDEHGLAVGDKIADKFSFDDEIDKLAIKDAITKLDEREQKIVFLRFYRDKTQSEVARVLNVSQVQISRLENKIIEKLKTNFSQ